MRSSLVASIAFLLLSVSVSACSSDPAPSGGTSAGQDLSSKGDPSSQGDSTAAPTPTPPPPSPAPTTPACTDIAGTYQPVRSQTTSGDCVVPDDMTPFVISKGDDGKWVLVDGDSTAEGTLDASTCTLHLQQHDDTAKADITVDYHFTASGYSADLSLTIAGAGTNDCDGKFTESGSKK